MQSPDVMLELRGAKPVASAELRERVLAVAAHEHPRQPSLSLPPLRRVALIAVAAALALAVGGAAVYGLVGSGSSEQRRAVTPHLQPKIGRGGGGAFETITPKGAPARSADRLSTIPNTPARLQQYGATLRVQVGTREELSDATKRAMRIARLLGGYVASIRYSAPKDGQGSAAIVVRVPVDRVQDAIEEYSSLGTILAQQVKILDVTQKVDRQVRTIATLRRKIRAIERKLADPSLSAAQRERLEYLLRFDRARLRRAQQSKALTVRRANFARVALDLSTKPKAAASRFDRTMGNAGDALVREGEILLYALIVAGPLLLLGLAAVGATRFTQRRRDAQLLERT